MIDKVLLSFSTLLALPMCAYAWGALGHETVGYVAMDFLSSDTLSFVQSTIADSFDNSLGPAGPWADTVRSEKAFKFSAPFHFIDAEDQPLNGSCSVNEDRDCGSSGCLLTAIANYTQRVADTSLDSTQRQQALMFIDHFLGDIGQPLHVEAYEVGGNDIKAICNGKSTNLHASWDTGMLETMLDANFDGSVTAWASNLSTSIKNGSYQSQAASWISCSSTTQTRRARSLQDEIRAVIDSGVQARAAVPELACPLVWAKESNAFDCTDVFDFSTGEDLCTGTYFDNAVPIINLQIAKQGYRLAAWLNVIIDGATNLP
ncbi:nuclease Le1 [Phellopilus nigrolimitatus]|nr:nuclease Le1 [Phellopilus nigrolimitatus]